jgi:alkylhydroperoxidase family enzyme
MSRIRLNETNDLPEDYRWIFERMEKNASLLNIFRAFSHSPEAMKRFMKLGTYILQEGVLDPGLRELAILRAGALCRSPYEFSQHISFARRTGLSDAQIRGTLQPNTALFDRRQMAVLAYAGELTTESRVSQATYDAVAAFLNAEEIVELTLTTGYYNMVSRMLNALEVDIDPAAQRDLDRLEADFPA